MTVHNSMGVVGKDPGTGGAVPLVTPADVRATLSALVRRRTNSTQPDTGRLKGGRFGDLTVSAGAGWTYVVEPGAVIIGATATRGADIVVSDSVVTLATDPSPSSGSRYDVVYVAQKDAFDSGNDATAAVIDLAKGSVAPSGAPSMPNLPPNAVILGTNLMQASATSTGSTGNTIANPLGFSSLAGGIGIYNTLAEMQGDDSRDWGSVGFLTADRHLYLRTNNGTGTGAADAPLATWDDLPTRRANVQIGHSDSGSVRSGSSGTLTYTSSTFTVPPGRRGTVRAYIRMSTYGGSGANYAGNLLVTIDGTDVQTTRYHNQARSGWMSMEATELSFSVAPGQHTVSVRQAIDGGSTSFEVWYVRAEIIAEW